MVILIPEKKAEFLIREDGKRLDGRELDELRPFKCRIGVLHNADGSAYVEHGKNKILAGVYGPREVHPRHMARPDRGILRVYYRMATFSVHERASPAPNRRALEISKIIEDALKPVLFLELYPGSQIEIFILVFAADGGTRCASTTAAALALADAGIPMKSLVAGVAAGKADGKIILDCSDDEDKAGEADMPAAVIMKDESITLLQFDGQMTPDELNTALNLIRKGARQIFKKQVAAIKEKFLTIQQEAEKEYEIIRKMKSTAQEKAEVKQPPQVAVPVTTDREDEKKQLGPATAASVSVSTAPQTNGQTTETTQPTIHQPTAETAVIRTEEPTDVGEPKAEAEKKVQDVTGKVGGTAPTENIGELPGEPVSVSDEKKKEEEIPSSESVSATGGISVTPEGGASEQITPTSEKEGDKTEEGTPGSTESVGGIDTTVPSVSTDSQKEEAAAVDSEKEVKSGGAENRETPGTDAGVPSDEEPK